ILTIILPVLGASDGMAHRSCPLLAASASGELFPDHDSRSEVLDRSADRLEKRYFGSAFPPLSLPPAEIEQVGLQVTFLEYARSHRNYEVARLFQGAAAGINVDTGAPYRGIVGLA